MKNFELLLVKENEKDYDIIGITYSNSLLSQPDLNILKASFLTIQTVKQLLSEGKKLKVAKEHKFAEITENELIIVNEENELDIQKNIALNEIEARMHQLILGVSVINAMDYLDCYMSLLNAGIAITDKNREEKYFEIIEAAQNIEEPEDLPENATFEEEQEHFKQKTAYNEAQDNLKTLETYLNTYDNLRQIKFVNTILKTAKFDIMASKTIDEINEAVEKYKNKIKIFNEH